MLVSQTAKDGKKQGGSYSFNEACVMKKIL